MSLPDPKYSLPYIMFLAATSHTNQRAVTMELWESKVETPYHDKN
jgi:hypothetical protein